MSALDKALLREGLSAPVTIAALVSLSPAQLALASLRPDLDFLTRQRAYVEFLVRRSAYRKSLKRNSHEQRASPPPLPLPLFPSPSFAASPLIPFLLPRRSSPRTLARLRVSCLTLGPADPGPPPPPVQPAVHLGARGRGGPAALRRARARPAGRRRGRAEARRVAGSPRRALRPAVSRRRPFVRHRPLARGRGRCARPVAPGQGHGQGPVAARLELPVCVPVILVDVLVGVRR